jgi:beta-galactosidase beta subunit
MNKLQKGKTKMTNRKIFMDQMSKQGHKVSYAFTVKLPSITTYVQIQVLALPREAITRTPAVGKGKEYGHQMPEHQETEC